MVWKAINNRIPSLTNNLLCRLLQNSCAGEVSFLISPWFPFMTNEGELKWSIYSSICYVYYGTHSYVPINPRPEDIIWSLSTSWKSETLQHAGNISNMTSNMKTARDSRELARCRTSWLLWNLTSYLVDHNDCCVKKSQGSQSKLNRYILDDMGWHDEPECEYYV